MSTGRAHFNLSSRPRATLAAVLAVALSSLAQPCAAQTPNPLVRPAARDVTLQSTPLGLAGTDGRPRIPQARPLPEGGAGFPMPGSTAAAPGGNGLTPHASPDALAREELAHYAVTAIVDQEAILRLNAPQNAQQSGDSGSRSQQQATQPQVVRVTSGVPVSIAGATLVPHVNVSYVEFFASGSRVSLATVALESASGKRPGDAREAFDAGYGARLAPNRGSSSTSAQPGASTPAAR